MELTQAIAYGIVFLIGIGIAEYIRTTWQCEHDYEVAKVGYFDSHAYSVRIKCRKCGHDPIKNWLYFESRATEDQQ